MAKPGGISAERLKSLIERVERVEEEIKVMQGDKRDIYSEAKGGGFDVKAMRKVIALRKMDAADRDEQDAILAVYLQALGMEPGPTVGSIEINEEAAEEVVDKRAVRAIELLRSGMSIRKVAGALEMGHGTVQRLSQALARKQVPAIEPVPAAAVPAETVGTPAAGTPSHNPETGEIEESEAAPKAATAAMAGNEAVTAPPIAFDTPSPAGGGPLPADISGCPATPEPSPAGGVPAGEPDDPTVDLSVHHNGERLAATGKMPMSAMKALATDVSIPDFLDRRKKLLAAVAESRGEA